MKVSRNWLRSYVSIGLPDEVLAERLTMAGLEVESYHSQSASLAGMVVGEVKSVERHANASKLTVCNVFDGTGLVQVVCGAPNVAAGQKVAFAPAGSVVPRNQHDPDGGPLTIRKVLIRGAESSGMICSGFELGLSDDASGIMVLPASARSGQSLAKQLGMEDTIFDIGVTANRPDLLSHIGVAREISALTLKPLKVPKPIFPKGKQSTRRVFSVEVLDPRSCPRYAARVIGRITVGPSPEWIRNALTAVGIRPVNNVVDVTNYVLMESGQPLHAFDYDKITGHTIIVRPGEGTSKFTTLDGKVREVNGDTLLICDGSGPLAIGGVMGGQNSEITPGTTTVVLESAYFDPVSIRKTSKRLGLSTEASQRFERGVDPGNIRWAIDRAAELLHEIAGGEVFRGCIDHYPVKIRERHISYNIRKSNALLGVTISSSKTSSMFNRIGIRKQRVAADGSVVYAIPGWRPDLTRPVDLTEEAARLFGYDKIDTSGAITIIPSGEKPSVDFSDLIRDYLSTSGFHEVVTNSMTDREVASIGGVEPVTLANPLSIEMGALRTNLLPGLLSTIKHNLFHGIESSRFYEIGNVFRLTGRKDRERLDSYLQEERLCIAIYGLESPQYWEERPRKSSIFTLKGEANALFRKFGLDNPRYIPYPTPTALSERSISIELNGEGIGSFGSVSRSLLQRFDIDTEVYFLEVTVPKLRALFKAGVTFRPYSRFPVVRRDLAVIVPESISIGRIEETIRRVGGPMLREILLFDIYRGEQSGDGMKSCAFSLEFVPQDRTLEQRDILDLMGKLTGELQSSLGAVLRQ